MASNLWLDLCRTGTAAQRLTTPPDASGFVMYYATDTLALSLWNGAAWVAMAAAVSVQTPLVAGTTQTLAGATPIVGTYADITTCANAGDGVALPVAPSVGATVWISNAGAAAAKVWPGETASQIDGGTAGAGVTLTNGKSAKFTCVTVTAGAANWQSIGMATRSA
jgi:hypothetical protein